MSGSPADARSSSAARHSALRRPPALREGDAVALISPSSHQGDSAAHMPKAAAKTLEAWGLQVINAGEPEARHLYLAGSDSHRAAQFQRYYCDPEIKGLFFTRGGYGAARILPLLQREKIAAAAPKAVVGFSDATALFAYLHAVAGISVIHGPCLAAPALARTPPQQTELDALRQALFRPQDMPAFDLQFLPQAHRPAEAVSGPLLGGSLAVLVTTLGTPWEIDTRGALLFLEDVNEAPYRIDRMLTHLRTAGKFEALGGIVLGQFTDCDEDPPGLLREVWLDLFAEAPFPVVTGLPAGHGAPNLALPLGQHVQLAPAGNGAARLSFI